MLINELMNRKGISQYRLCKEIGIGQATLSDILSGKTNIWNIKVDTLYKISKFLGVTMEELLEKREDMSDKSSFDTFKGNVCHDIKDKGDIGFIISTLKSNEIEYLYHEKKYLECFYLLASVDYLSRVNNIPYCTKYDEIREMKLPEMFYTRDVLMLTELMNTDEYKREAVDNAIPEFLRFNIAEGGIRDVA